MVRILFASTLILLSGNLWSTPVTVTTFSPGTSISSSAVNANFANIVNAFNTSNAGLYIFPNTAGTVGEVLTVDGGGGLSWMALPGSSGVSTLNGQTSGVQTLAVGSNGMAPAWNSAGGTHTLDIPMASSGVVTAGLISNADYMNFQNKMNNPPAGNPGDSLIWNGSFWNGGNAFTSSGFMVKLDNDYLITCPMFPTIPTDYHKVNFDSATIADFGTYPSSALPSGVYEILLDIPYTYTGYADPSFVLYDGTTEIKVKPGRSVKRLTSGTWNFYIGCSSTTGVDTMTIEGSKLVYGLKKLN